MRKLKYFVVCSVDGFIAGEDGSIDAFVNDEDYFAELFEAFPRPAQLIFARHSECAERTGTSTPS